MRDRSISTVLCIALLGVSGFVSAQEVGDVAFRRGDADTNGTLNVNDPIVTLGFLFQGSETPGGVAQRLIFDAGRDELISISYSNGAVVIVAKRAAFSLVTGRSLVDLTYIESFGASPQGGQTLRVWDTESTALLEALVDFAVLPDVSN